MRKCLLVAWFAIAACAGKKPAPDALLMNVPFGGVCTSVTDTSVECTTGVCTNSFDMLSTPICSVKCTMLMALDPSECPAGSSQMCNKKGYCKP